MTQPTPQSQAMSAHTAGPWSVSQPWCGFSQINGANGELIFGLAAGREGEKQADDVCDANARLIAAAPDLYLIVKRLIEGVDTRQAVITGLVGEARAILARVEVQS